MRPFSCVLAWLVLGLTSMFPVYATNNRYLLASQDDWNAKRGFVLDLENAAPGNATCHLVDTTLALGVANGQEWHFAVLNGPWQPNHLYTATATIGPTQSQISLDGRMLSAMPHGFVPDTSPLLAHQMPDWATDPADYAVQQTQVEVQETSAGKHAGLMQAWTPDEGPVSGLALLAGAPDAPFVQPLALRPGATVSIHVSFEFVPQPADPVAYLRSISPLIDRYGQAIPAHGRDKVTSDIDLTGMIAEEAARYHYWPPPAHRDAFGGATNTGWALPPTGYYALTRHGGKWWLVTPSGHPCFYTGVDTAPDINWDLTPVTGREFLFAELPPHDGLYSAVWTKNAWGDGADRDYVSFIATNLIRKYGADWQAKADQSTVKRLQEWGFSGMGKWCAGTDLGPAHVPYIPVLSHHDVPNLVDHPDIFDPAVQVQFRASLSGQILPHLADADILAWSIGNEYDEIIKPDEIKAILAMPATVPARQALVADALNTLYHGDLDALEAAWKMTAADSAAQPSDTDIEALRQFYESRYYAFLYQTVKALDPHHLYAGYWPSIGWWVGPQDFRLLGPNCDLIGYDRYDPQFADRTFQTLIDQTHKPILCGEFSFPPFYEGRRGYGKYGTSAVSDADAGRLYARWVHTAATEPDCVGTCWFQYRDEPLAGRGPGAGPQPTLGEHYAFGLVDDTDRPKWPLVTAVRAANLAALSERLVAGQRKDKQTDQQK